ncbi:MAG TPA: hypothetical protein VHC41_05330 [Mycobacteriales bacterium]|jgi:hypothetical protein|nr:hypothetical protein [Mycobacteriales bacterium]
MAGQPGPVIYDGSRLGVVGIAEEFEPPCIDTHVPGLLSRG